MGVILFYFILFCFIFEYALHGHSMTDDEWKVSCTFDPTVGSPLQGDFFHSRVREKLQCLSTIQEASVPLLMVLVCSGGVETKDHNMLLKLTHLSLSGDTSFPSDSLKLANTDK